MWITLKFEVWNWSKKKIMVSNTKLEFCFVHKIYLKILFVFQPEITQCLKRTSSKIFESGGFIRRIDNLGVQDTPWKISSHDAIHKQASYFIVEFDAPSSALAPFNNYLSRDIDIIKRTIFRVPENKPQPKCTLHEELRPPAYRLVECIIAIYCIIFNIITWFYVIYILCIHTYYYDFLLGLRSKRWLQLERRNVKKKQGKKFNSILVWITCHFKDRIMLTIDIVNNMFRDILIVILK